MVETTTDAKVTDASTEDAPKTPPPKEKTDEDNPPNQKELFVDAKKNGR